MKFSLGFCLIVFTLLSCSRQKVEYDDNLKLEGFIKTKTSQDVTVQDKNSLIVILQNEDCICTDPDMELTKELFKNDKFSSYQKTLIVSSKNHKIFKRIDNSFLKKITVIYNNENDLLKAGYVAMTDRVIVYEKGICSYYADLHIKKPDIARDELL